MPANEILSRDWAKRLRLKNTLAFAHRNLLDAIKAAEALGDDVTAHQARLALTCLSDAEDSAKRHEEDAA